MYEYLKGIGLHPVMHRRGPKKRHRIYHIEFTPDYREDYWIERIITDWGYLRGFNRIHLCLNEIVLENGMGAKVNINYKDINKFEVVLEEDEEYINTTV